MKAAFRTLAAVAIICAAASPALAEKTPTPTANYKLEIKGGLATAEQVKADSANVLRWLSQYAKREGVENYTVKIENTMFYQTDRPFAVLTVRADALKMHYTLNTPILNKENILPQIKTGIATLVNQSIEREREKEDKAL